jgi:creatinine amidohydrolase
VIGDPLPATREQGEAILASLAESWAKAITELHELRWVTRNERSWGKVHNTGDVAAGFD